MELFRRNRKRKKTALEDWIESLVIAAIFATLIKGFLIQTYLVPTGSMENTIMVGDFLFANLLRFCRSIF